MVRRHLLVAALATAFVAAAGLAGAGAARAHARVVTNPALAGTVAPGPLVARGGFG